MIQFISHSIKDTDLIAKKIAAKIKTNDIIALNGDLGTGKTTFTRSLVKYLGSKDLVSSPTFSLVNHYQATPEILHFDMYRIKNEFDLYSIGFFDYIENNYILIIEWSENIKNYLPKNSINITFLYVDEQTRQITINPNGDENI